MYETLFFSFFKLLSHVNLYVLWIVRGAHITFQGILDYKKNLPYSAKFNLISFIKKCKKVDISSTISK